MLEKSSTRVKKEFLKGLKDYLLKNHGATLNYTDFSYFKDKKGYMVSLYGTEERFDNVDKLIGYLSLYQVKSGCYVGIWYHEGLWYLDNSVQVFEKQEAILKAKKNFQLAIYDLKNDVSINLDYSINYYTAFNNSNNDVIECAMSIKELSSKINCGVSSIKKAIATGTSLNGWDIVSERVPIKELVL